MLKQQARRSILWSAALLSAVLLSSAPSQAQSMSAGCELGAASSNNMDCDVGAPAAKGANSSASGRSPASLGAPVINSNTLRDAANKRVEESENTERAFKKEVQDLGKELKKTAGDVGLGQKETPRGVFVAVLKSTVCNNDAAKSRNKHLEGSC